MNDNIQFEQIDGSTAHEICEQINQKLQHKEYTLGEHNPRVTVETTGGTIDVLGADADNKDQIVDLSTPDGCYPYHPPEVKRVEAPDK